MRRPAITAVILEKILAFLAPLFLDVAGDISTAREAARVLLESYSPRTDRELRHAALVIAFSFAALDALSRSVNSELTVNQVLRLRGNANALNRAALQNEQALEALHALPPEVPLEAPLEALPEADEPTEAATLDLPASLEPADLAKFARTQPVLSRQQRRALERQAEKARRRQQEQARLAQRAAANATRNDAAVLQAAQ
ncbi:MAG: hypothetical protein ACJ8AI_12570 [Rhodopila sp.]